MTQCVKCKKCTEKRCPCPAGAIRAFYMRAYVQKHVCVLLCVCVTKLCVHVCEKMLGVCLFVWVCVCFVRLEKKR